MTRIVMDTNVLLSALLFPGSAPDQVFQMARRGQVTLILSPFILDEFQRILKDKFEHSDREAKERAAFVHGHAELVEPTEELYVVKAHQDDNRILECAVAAGADFLVTGDKAHLLPLRAIADTRILNPAEFLDTMGAERRE